MKDALFRWLGIHECEHVECTTVFAVNPYEDKDDPGQHFCAVHADKPRREQWARKNFLHECEMYRPALEPILKELIAKQRDSQSAIAKQADQYNQWAAMAQAQCAANTQGAGYRNLFPQSAGFGTPFPR